MSRLINDGNLSQQTMENINPMTTSNNLMDTRLNDDGEGRKKKDPLKQLKTTMPKKGNPCEDKPNRRGKVNQSVPIKLYISGRNLKDMSMLSKSDPVCVVYEKAQDREEWFEIGRTEFIKDTLDPNFV